MGGCKLEFPRKSFQDPSLRNTEPLYSLPLLPQNSRMQVNPQITRPTPDLWSSCSFKEPSPFSTLFPVRLLPPLPFSCDNTPLAVTIKDCCGRGRYWPAGAYWGPPSSNLGGGEFLKQWEKCSGSYQTAFQCGKPFQPQSSLNA